MEEYDALHEGIPFWLLQSLCTWIANALNGDERLRSTTRDCLGAVERALRLPLDWTHDERCALKSVIDVVRHDPGKRLEIIDHCLLVSHDFRDRTQRVRELREPK
jgi:hypothetical protein